jgi:hypothetical protein
MKDERIDKEIQYILDHNKHLLLASLIKPIAKTIATEAQRDLWQWLNEPCKEHRHPYQHRYLCIDCLAELNERYGQEQQP